jgi:hypothetical protein
MTLIGLLVVAAVTAKPPTGTDYLVTHLRPGHVYSNVFSISRSIKAEGFEELVRRNGGSADYTIMTADADSARFKVVYRYDGQPPGTAGGDLRDGGRTSCFDGKCAPSTDASGLIYNPALWGTPPDRLSVGLTWTVRIGQPWELGGPNGTQTVTVVRADPAAGTATLMREGSSEGFFAGEPTQVNMTRDGQTIALDLLPGVSNWRGYATFSNGVVISDELVVTRMDTLRSKDGQEVTGIERRIMLLNASPPPPVPSV